MCIVLEDGFFGHDVHEGTGVKVSSSSLVKLDVCTDVEDAIVEISARDGVDVKPLSAFAEIEVRAVVGVDLLKLNVGDGVAVT